MTDGRLIDKLLQRFGRGRESGGRSVAEDETFVNLIVIAREDPEVRRTLEAILTADAFHRKSMLNTWLDDLRAKKAPKDFITALGHLLDDEVAEKALEMIRKPD